MRRSFALLTLLCLSPASWAEPPKQMPSEAKGWRGLVPLRATRRDVEGLLGAPQTAGGSNYETDDATIYIDYSDGPCEKGWPYGWNVEKDTVTRIFVRPKEVMAFQELRLDEKKYEMSRDRHVPSRLYYVDRNAGLTIDVDEFTKRVGGFSYHPTAADAALICPDAANLLPVGRRDADPFFRFDVYGDLSPAAERERLDSVAAELIRDSTAEGYLIAYAGRIARTGEAAARASCAREYLIKKHRIDPGRIRTVDGGYQENLLVEIYVEPKDGDVPLARPSVRPSKIQITRQKPAPKCALHSQN